MADLSRERLLELERATKDKTGELFSLISMALRCLDMQEALEAAQYRVREIEAAPRCGSCGQPVIRKSK